MAVVAAASLLAACTSGSGSGAATVPATDLDHIPPATAPAISLGPAQNPVDTTPAWSVDTGRCTDKAAVAAPITGTLTIGSVAPQSGGLISTVDRPIIQGFKAYIDHANSTDLLKGVQLNLVVADDHGDAALTPAAVSGLLAADAQVVSGIIGSANNLAVRDLLNRQCIPQLMALGNSPKLGDVASAPWTMGALVPVTVEATVYADSIVRLDGPKARIALLVSDDDQGEGEADAFIAAAADTSLQVVDKQTVHADNILPPVDELTTIAGEKPDVIFASLAGAACATFLTQLAVAEAATPGWKPTIYMASGCADGSILALAGPAANGVLTSTNLTDDEPTFTAAMAAAGVTSSLAPAAEGWTAAEVTVAILRQAQASPAGLTRVSIMDAARSLSYTPTLALPGVHYITDGTDDAYPAESLQVVQFDATTHTFVDVGPLVAQFES
ncbi:MAG TPA: ABC transporter substrate-binding protein [Ilumatobacteraceae bacterium]